jgi:hypothetical protein
MAAVLFLIGATTVAVGAPVWALVALVLVWGWALVLCLMWFTRRPKVVVLVPVAVSLVWFAVVVGGAKYLGWS